MMGLGMCYFVVLSPSGMFITTEVYDAVYTTQSLLQSLLKFWHYRVIPAFEERDHIEKDKVFVGWIPSKKRESESE